MAKRSGTTKSSSPAKEKLLKAINNLPHSSMSDRQFDLENPIPYVGKEISRDIILNQDRWYDNEIGVKNIEISKIETVQPIVMKSTLLSKINGDGDTKDIPVILYKGRYLLFDGNHTVAIKKLRGDKSVKVRLLRYIEK